MTKIHQKISKNSDRHNKFHNGCSLQQAGGFEYLQRDTHAQIFIGVGHSHVTFFQRMHINVMRTPDAARSVQSSC
jgi:hypothetical protein